MINTLVPYVGLWYVMSLVSSIAWWMAAPIALLAAGFLVRIFIIFHDCGHGSFLSSKRANAVLGFISGVLTFVPFRQWWSEHAKHHARAGNLDARGLGDIWTLTVREYASLPPLRRIAYRIARNPAIMFIVAPLLLFVIRYRFVAPGASRRERRSVIWTNIGIVGMAAALSLLFGPVHYMLFQGSVMLLAGAIGVWLFYVQHQFEGVYWERSEHWSYRRAALQGSSYYQLPAVLQWFTGSIGYHHVHHLCPSVPNYYLQRCHSVHPDCRHVQPLTVSHSVRALRLRLWDDEGKRLVRFPKGFFRDVLQSARLPARVGHH